MIVLIRITRIFCRKILQSKVRNLLTVINMGIGIALCLLIASIGVNIFHVQSKQLYASNYFNLIEVYKDSRMSEQKDDFKYTTFSEDEFEILSKIPNVDGIRVAKSNNIQLTQIGDKPIEIGEVLVTSIYQKHNFLFGSRNKTKADSKVMIAGRELKNQGEIVITQLLIERMGIEAKSIIGKTAEIEAYGSEYIVKIVGVLKDDSGLMFDPTKYQNVFILNSTFEKNEGYSKNNSEFDTVTLHISNFKCIQKVVTRLESLHYAQQNYSRQIKESKSYFTLIINTILIIGILLLIACIWVLKISLTISLDEKLKFIGLLKAIGFQNFWTRYLIIIESICFFWISSIIGLLISQLSSVVLKSIVNAKTIFGVNQNVFLLNPMVIIITLMVSLVVCLCFCIYPCKMVGQVSVLEIMKSDS